MTLVTFRSECRRVEASGNWLVLCLRCGDEIGTMNSEQLREAVFRTAHRGGVICPECRAKSCKYCGVELSGDGLLLNERDVGYCLFCEIEERHLPKSDCPHGFRATLPQFQAGFGRCPACVLEEMNKQNVDDAACLVSHISREKPEKSLAGGLKLLVSDGLGWEWEANWQGDVNSYVKTMQDCGFDVSTVTVQDVTPSEYEKAMIEKGSVWLDDDGKTSSFLCRDKDYLVGMDGGNE